MVKRSRHLAPPTRLPRTTPQMRLAVSIGAGRKLLESHPDDKMVYAPGRDEPVCSALTMLKLCEMEWFRPVKQDARGRIYFRLTDIGFGIDRAIAAKYPNG